MNGTIKFNSTVMNQAIANPIKSDGIWKPPVKPTIGVTEKPQMRRDDSAPTIDFMDSSSSAQLSSGYDYSGSIPRSTDVYGSAKQSTKQGNFIIWLLLGGGLLFILLKNKKHG